MTEKSANGLFVWHDLMTTDSEAAQRFYTELFGWGIEIMPMGETCDYPMFTAHGEGHGGFVALSPESGVSSHWIGYVAVADVDQTASVMGDAVCVPPTDIPNVGRFCVLTGPGNSVTSPFTGANPEAPYQGPPRVGTIVWDELHAQDPEASKAHYQKAYGWDHRDLDLGETGTYHFFRAWDRDIAGMMQNHQEGPSAWVPYISVEDVDASVTQAEGLGAKTWVGPRDIPNVGRFSVHSDPTGAMFALIKFVEMNC